VQDALDHARFPLGVEADLLVQPAIQPSGIRQARLHRVLRVHALVHVKIGRVQSPVGTSCAGHQNSDPGESGARRITQFGEMLFHVAQIRAAVARFVAAVAGKFGGVDVCVTNAGGPPAKGFLAATLDDWQRAVEANFLSTVYFCREVIPHMQRKKWGRIITITSITTKQPVTDLVLSNAVRAGVVGLVKSLANEFGKDGILVNNVGPGFTATDRLKQLAKARSAASGKSEREIFESWAVDAAQKRIGEPREVADAIVWLASERASFVTGQTILVDGGAYKGL